VFGSSAKVFLVILAAQSTLLPLHNFLIDAPLYFRRYHDDQAANKTYFSLWPGLEDAATTRLVTHRLADWKEDLFWMTMYFGPGAWGGLLLMYGPRLSPAKRQAVLGSHRLPAKPPFVK